MCKSMRIFTHTHTHLQWDKLWANFFAASAGVAASAAVYFGIIQSEYISDPQPPIRTSIFAPTPSAAGRSPPPPLLLWKTQNPPSPPLKGLSISPIAHCHSITDTIGVNVSIHRTCPCNCSESSQDHPPSTPSPHHTHTHMERRKTRERKRAQKATTS